MIVAAIDPGNEGAICVMETLSQKILKLVDMPILIVAKSGKTKKGNKRSGKVLDGSAVKNVLSAEYHIGNSPTDPCYNIVRHVFIEKSQVMPKQGIVSGGNYMMAYGTLIGICIGLPVPYTLIRPNMWKKAMMQGMTKGKEASIVRVKQLYPELELNRKKDHGKCDAILLTLHGISGGYL